MQHTHARLPNYQLPFETTGIHECNFMYRIFYTKTVFTFLNYYTCDSIELLLFICLTAVCLLWVNNKDYVDKQNWE